LPRDQSGEWCQPFSNSNAGTESVGISNAVTKSDGISDPNTDPHTPGQRSVVEADSGNELADAV